MNDGRLRIVLVGLGNRARRYLQYLLTRPELVEIAAVADLDAQRLSEAGMEYSLPSEILFNSVDDFLASGIETDAAIVATNDDSHFEIGCKLLKRQTALLLEKPMARTEPECEALLAASSGVTAGLCYVLRYHPYFKRIVELSSTPGLGRIKSVHHKVVVGIDRMTHTFVRGLWSRAVDSSPIFLSKCSHDVDWLFLLTGCNDISEVEVTDAESSLSRYCPSSAPAQAADRCINCVLSETCRYSAVDLYVRRGEWTDNFIPMPGQTKEELIDWELRYGRYGRCVYHCDNDVEDYCRVVYRLSGGIVLEVEMDGLTDGDGRETAIEFENGSIEAVGNSIRMTGPSVNLYEDWSRQCGQPSHAGADFALVDDFIEAVRTGGQMCSSLRDACTSTIACIRAALYLQHKNNKL